MKNILLFTLGIAFSFSAFNSCKSETIEDVEQLTLKDDFKTITRNSALENYEIKVPKYMEPTEILNPDAKLQFLHLYNEEYIIVINESKQDFKQMIAQFNEFDNKNDILSKYSNFQMQFLTQKMNILNSSKTKQTKINTLNAKNIELLAKVNNVDENISYFITFIEGKENLYFVMAWTIESKEAVFRAKYKKIIGSFYIN